MHLCPVGGTLLKASALLLVIPVSPVVAVSAAGAFALFIYHHAEYGYLISFNHKSLAFNRDTDKILPSVPEAFKGKYLKNEGVYA